MKYSIFFLPLLLIIACGNNKSEIILPDFCFVNAKEYGAVGDGVTDDRASIQMAINACKTVVFPKGTYLLASKSDPYGLLLLEDDRCPQKLIFEEGAVLKVAASIPSHDSRLTVMCIRANKQDIESITLENVQIDGNRANTRVVVSGIQAIEKEGYNIKELGIKRANIKNVGWLGIYSGALTNYFSDIYTENCGLHGIDIYNPSNKNQEHFFYLDGHTSVDDDGYSIDFSAVENGEAELSLPEFSWTGTAKNIRSYNSKYGIKTAGYWNLELQDVLIENSGGNGFFINLDAPGKKIEMLDVHIKNARNNGMSLTGKTSLVGKNILIEGCRVGMTVEKTDVEIEALIIDGKNQNDGGIRMGSSNIAIRDFTIKNNAAADDFPVWISGSNVTLERGTFEDNDSPFELIINESAGTVMLKEIVFGIGNGQKNGILNNQVGGKTNVVQCDFTNIKGNSIEDRTGTICVTESTGL